MDHLPVAGELLCRPPPPHSHLHRRSKVQGHIHESEAVAAPVYPRYEERRADANPGMRGMGNIADSRSTRRGGPMSIPQVHLASGLQESIQFDVGTTSGNKIVVRRLSIVREIATRAAEDKGARANHALGWNKLEIELWHVFEYDRTRTACPRRSNRCNLPIR